MVAVIGNTPFGNPKKVNGHNLQCVDPFKYLKFMFAFTFKTKIKRISAKKGPEALLSISTNINSPYPNREYGLD